MTPAAAGRHCAACQKVVVDFTALTDAEVLAYFRQAPPDGTCGRFRSGQLGRPLAEAPRRRVAWLSGLLLAALGATGCQPALPAPQLRTEAPGQLLSPGDSVLVTVAADSAATDEAGYLMGDVEELRPKQ